MKNSLKVIAYYLPQYHAIPENDEWWGRGFTEWVNVKKAQPLFKGHMQPKVPAQELGYYDLLNDNVRRKQAELAKEAGIDGFCYWHYWFGNGKELLEKPFKMTLKDKDNNFGFCLGWANESWKAKQWNKDGSGDKMLIEQSYPGREDDDAHFYAYLDAFKDDRYIKYDGKPVFLIYRPMNHPHIAEFIARWNYLAKENRLSDGFCFIAELSANHTIGDVNYYLGLGFSYVTRVRKDMGHASFTRQCLYCLKNFILRRPIRVIDYNSFIKWGYTTSDNKMGFLPNITPNWDHSPRSGRKCTVLHDSTPELFYKYAKKTLEINKNGSNLPFLFIKSWNEWGEGNYMEPDITNGKGYIEALKRAIEFVYNLKEETND